MRILHTSDWHLGIRSGPTPRDSDHDRVLAWMAEEIEARKIDALLIVGDVFDAMQPSAEALRRWYSFLARLADTDLPQVVVIGGNHDSPARLEAPAELLQQLRVRVVGGPPSADGSWTDCALPLRDRSGALGAVALAVPYVHEFRLGVRTTDLDQRATRAAFTQRFSALYEELASHARQRWPDLPLVALGHLTVGSQARREDYPHEIHQVGSIEALPAEIFPPEIDYVALGHIHRAYPVAEGHRVWYSGTPLATSLPEARSPRRVLQVEIQPGEPPGVQPIEVPSPRALLELGAPPEELVQQVAALSWEEPLPPLLYLRVHTDDLPSGLQERLHTALARHPEAQRPTLVELRQIRQTPLPISEQTERQPLRDLAPEEVFHSLLRTTGRQEQQELRRAFAALHSASQEDLQQMIRDVDGESA